MTMTMTDLERAHQNFYVPAYQILVDGKDLLMDKYMEIASVQVDNTLKGADRFTFTVNSTFNFEKREFAHLTDLFAFGKPVVIYMGYKDAEKLPLMLRGKVTAVQTSFPANGLPQITVSGFDLSYCMTIGTGKEPLKWANRKDSEIVAELAGQYGLNPKVEDTKVKHPITEKGQQSDMQFIEKLAERNGFEFYTFDTDLYFQRPKNVRETANNGDPVVFLEWGRGLLSFSPEMNISQQITKVEVRGWDVNSKKEIVGTAGKGDEPRRDTGRQSGGDVMQTVCRDQGELKIRVPVFSKQEADRWAQAILKKRAEQFVQGSGESIGLPEIRADENIKLEGLGTPFSKVYYIEQSTHTINSSGYRTTFKVKDTTI
jgi:hypothetical protein